MKKVLFFALVIAAMLLSACGQQAAPQAPGSDQAGGQEAAPEAAETEAAQPEEPAASDELYTVKMIQWPGPESDAMQIVIDWFNENKAEEAGFKVEMLLFGRDQMWQKQEAIMASASDEVDIFYMASRQLGKYHTFMEPLDDYLNDPEVNIWGAKTSDWMESSIKGVTWFDGKLYSNPRDISAHFLYYRQDYMDQLLSDPAWQETYKQISKEQMGVEMTPKAPEEWTWDDYLAASYFFTKQYNPNSPTEYGNFTHGKVMGPTAFLWTNAYWGYGGDWFTEDGEVSFDNDAARQALNIWKTSFEKGLTPPSSINGEYPEDNEAMMAGQVAMTVHWNAAYITVNGEESPTAGKWAAVAPPAGPEGRFVYNHTLALSMNKNSSHKTEAARWLSWLFTEEAARLYADAGGIPPMPSVLKDMADTNPSFAIMADLVAEYGRALPPTAGTIEIMTCEALSNAWSGDMAVDDALKQLQENAATEMANWD